jgi:uncharacterized repeat protein (TIGR01451 family)
MSPAFPVGFALKNQLASRWFRPRRPLRALEKPPCYRLRLEQLEDRTVPAAADLHQWSNVGANWQNGNLNHNQAILLEGDSVPYQDQFNGLSVGPRNNYVFTIQWQTTNMGKHALDYLTSYDYTWNGGSGTGSSVDGHALDGTGLPSSTPFTTFQIPIDPNINSGPPSNFMINGRTPVGSPTNPPDQFFTMYGATLTGVFGYTTYPLTGTTTQTLSISFTTAPTASVPNPVSNPVLLWGGHIASQLDWGPGSGAGSISGSPYHMSQESLTLNGDVVHGVGSQDRSLMADAVISPTIIVVDKVANPTTPSQDFGFANTSNVFFAPGQPANSVNSFSLDGSNTFTVPPYTLPGSSGHNVELLQTKTFGQPDSTRIMEGVLPAGWTLTGIKIHSFLTGDTVQSGPTAALNCVAGDTLWVTFTDTFHGTSSTADLALAKTVSNAHPNVGDLITYAVTLTNNGPGPGTGITVTDRLPGGLQLKSATTTQGVYDGASGLWTVGSVPSGGGATLTVMAQVVSPAPETNTAVISHSDSIDPNPSNNSASATEAAQQADLSIRKTVSNPTPNVGDAIVYTVTVTNNGPDNATGATVTDLLPAGLKFDSSNAGANYNSTTGLWTIGALANGASAVLNITATVVSPDPQLETATISHADQLDPHPGNNSAAVLETPQKADLVLSKVVDNPMPTVGATIHYTITLADAGPDTATNVSVLDLLPAGLTFGTATASQGSYDSGTGVWTVGTVDTSGPRTLTITAVVKIASSIANTASIAHSDQFDPDPTNNSATALVNPLQADLALAKTVDNPRPNVGDVITFTVTLTDNGPNNATGVVVSDRLPAGLTFVSDTASAGSYDPTSGVWTVGAVTTTTPQTLLIRARVVSPDAQTNRATITRSDQFDPNPIRNTAGALVTPQQADLVLSKAADIASPNTGDTIHYTITLTNAGPDTATNVSVLDLLPAGLTFVSATASQGSYNSGTGVWTVGTVDTSGPRTLTITAVVNDPEEESNTARISHTDQFDPDPTKLMATVVTVPEQADLELVKRVDNPRPNVGDVITYTVTLTDHGPNTATGVTVSDSLPAGLTFVSATASAGSYDPATGVWTVGTVTAAAPQTLRITARVVSPDATTNTATISHSDEFEPNPNNNSSRTTVTPQQADLVLGKTVDNPTPNVGDTIHYTLTLADLGPNAATNVTVQDILPAGATFVTASASKGSYDHTTNVWTVGTVDTSLAQTLTITVVVTGPDVLTNTASVQHSDQFDPDPANNTTGTLLIPQEADLELIKRVDNPTPNVGGTVTFTLTLTNNGPNGATAVAVSDRLPASLSFVSATPSAGSYDPASGVWTVGAVAVGSPQTLRIVATVVSHATITNAAVIARSDQFDPNPNNNRSTTTLTPQQADLAVTKEVDDPTPNVGDVVHFTVTVNNHGPNAATNVTLRDLLPAGLVFVSDTASQGSYDPTTGVWTVGTVETTSARTLTVAARVTGPGATTNTASVLHADQFDPNPAENSAGVTVMLPQADLAVAKAVNNPTPNVGDTITFVVDLSNLGPDPATNVRVTDQLPAGLSLITATPSQGTYDSTSGVWMVGQVDTTFPVTLMLMVRVVSPNPTTNLATVTHSDQFEPNPSNNSASATVTPLQADLHLSKSVSNPTPNVGDVVTFSVALTNSGPDSATGVQVTDRLPAGLAFVSATPSQGSYDRVSGVWTVGAVAVGAPQTLQIVATVVSHATINNVAVVAHSDQFDPNPDNNSSNSTVTPQQADLAVTKEVDDPTPNVGDVVHFTVTVNDRGPNAATNVTLRDLLPAGLVFVSDTASQGSYDPTSGVWTVGTVDTAAARTLTVLARLVSPTAQSNTASVTHSDTFDPDLTNNTASVTTTPQRADLGLSKVANQAQVPFDGNVTFTLSVSNRGPDTATNVFGMDPLPSGLLFVSATPSQGTFDPATGMWFVGTLANGAGAVLQVTGQVVVVGSVSNTAVAGAAQFDPNLSDNTATAAVVGTAPPLSKQLLLASSPFLQLAATPGAADLALPGPDAVRTDSAFVSTLYRDLMQRAPDAAGLAYWTGLLLAGKASQTDVAKELWESPEHRGLEVNQFYLTYLHRPADPVGGAWWWHNLLAGMSEADVISGILSSAEYQASHANDAAFVAGLYADVLGRAADPAGSAYWLKGLQGGVSRAQEAAAFLASREALLRVVDDDYTTFLNRPADSPGEMVFLSELMNGGPRQVEAVAVAILGSGEFSGDAAGV